MSVLITKDSKVFSTVNEELWKAGQKTVYKKYRKANASELKLFTQKQGFEVVPVVKKEDTKDKKIKDEKGESNSETNKA